MPLGTPHSFSRPLKDFATAVQRVKGYIRIGLQVDARGSKRLGELRARCLPPTLKKTTSQLRNPSNEMEDIISMIKTRLPAANRSLFEEFLSSIAPSQRPFELAFTEPFIHENPIVLSRAVKWHNPVERTVEVKWGLQSDEFLKLQEKCFAHLKELVPSEDRYRIRSDESNILVASRLSGEDAMVAFERAKYMQEFIGVQSVFAIGLALRVEYSLTPEVRRLHGADPRGTDPWTVFPFAGVHWDKPSSVRNDLPDTGTGPS